jgi:hypothetical protein
LVKYATKDPHGDYYHYMGYQYQTATQLLDINTKRLIPMCFHSQKYLELCDREFQKMVELGTDGILFDECQHHSPAMLCFDTSHEHRYGAPVYANDRKLIQNFTKISKPARPNFLYAGEACYDYEFEAYHLAYHRSENKKHLDYDAVFSAAREHDTAFEINASPNRLDLDEMYVRRAAEMGIPLAINTDAHAPDNLDLMEYGVSLARRAWVGLKRSSAPGRRMKFPIGCNYVNVHDFP